MSHYSVAFTLKNVSAQNRRSCDHFHWREQKRAVIGRFEAVLISATRISRIPLSGNLNTPHISFVIFGCEMGHVLRSAQKAVFPRWKICRDCIKIRIQILLSLQNVKPLYLKNYVQMNSEATIHFLPNGSVLVNIRPAKLKVNLSEPVPSPPCLCDIKREKRRQRHAWAYSFRTMNLIFSAVFMSQQWDLFFWQSPPQVCLNNGRLYSPLNQASSDSVM